VLIRQAEAIQRANLTTVADPADRNDVTQHYEAVMAQHALTEPTPETQPG
jgi:hypothetical protein